jgi:CheY-like chemotaxis protein
MSVAQASRLRILVVDDEDANLLFLEKALSRKGHQVILAHNGEEALSLFERVQPDLVLMDVMMPGWDGFETTRRIRAGGGSSARGYP